VVVLSTNGKDRNSGDPQGDPQTDEDRHEKLNRELLELLHELRVAIPGVQVLFAFLLVVPFSQGFSSVSTPQRYVYFATHAVHRGIRDAAPRPFLPPPPVVAPGPEGGEAQDGQPPGRGGGWPSSPWQC
jgi:hypothetical protein